MAPSDAEQTGRRMAVTGAGGFVGRHLVAAARAAGWRVDALERSDAARPIDVRDAAAVSAAMAASRPDAVVHLAFVQDGPEARSTIVDGSAIVAAAAAAAGARLVHLSSDLVFGGRLEPYTEADAPGPIEPYGQAKAEAEAAVAGVAPGAAIVRPSLVLGPPGMDRHQQAVLDALAGRRELTFFTDEERAPIHVDDLVRIVLRLATPGTPAAVHAGPVHTAGPDVVTRAELAAMIARYRNLDRRTLRAAPRPASVVRPARIVLVSALTTDVIGPSPRGVRTFLFPPGWTFR